MSATTVSRSWPAERRGVDVDADRLPRGEQMEAVADPAAEVEHAPRTELRLGQRVGRDMALPRRIEAPGRGHDTLAGDPHGRSLADRVRVRCGPRGSRSPSWPRSRSLGVVLRLSLLGDSLVADELSTRWMITAGGLWDVIAKVYTRRGDHAAAVVRALVAHHAGRAHATELLRLPSLLGGHGHDPAGLRGRRADGRAPARLCSAPRSPRSRRSCSSTRPRPAATR